MSAEVNENGLFIYSENNPIIKSVLEIVLVKCLVKYLYKISVSNNVVNFVAISEGLKQPIVYNRTKIIKAINNIDGSLNIMDIQVDY